MRERDDDAVAPADEAVELVLRLGQAARGDRRPLRLERERLSLREGVELRGALERDLVEPFLRPDPPHLVRLPDEVRGAVEHRHQVGRDLGRHGLAPVVLAERRLGQVGPALGGRVDHRPVDRMQRPLGERRERPHLLDLVAVELDSERLPAGGREDIDDAAADGELAALLGAVDALVAGERQRLCEPVEARLVSDLEANGLRPPGCGRDALGERRCRRANEAAAREHVEGTGSLADEVRGRLEAGAPPDAAPRQQRHVVRPDEPAGRLGRVASVGILRKQRDETAVELLVHGGQEQRQDGLGHARPRRQGSRERLQAVEREQLPDERMQYRTVHDERRKPGFRGRTSYSARPLRPRSAMMSAWASAHPSR